MQPQTLQVMSLLDHLGDALFLLDSQFRVTVQNAAADRLSARQASTTAAAPLWDCWESSTAEFLQEHLRRVLSDGASVHYEHHAREASGRDLWLDLHILPADTGLAVVVQDITTQKQDAVAARVLRHLESEFAGLTGAGDLDQDALHHDDSRLRRALEATITLIAERTRRDQRARQLQDLTAALSAALDPKAVGKAIIERAMPTLGANAGNVFLLDTDNQELMNLAVLGYEPEIERWAQRLPLDGPTLVAEVARSGTPILLSTWEERIARYPHHRSVHAKDGDRAVAGLPLKAEGKIIGALSLAFPTDRPFDEDDRLFMTTVADLCAQALERSRLYEAVRLSETRFRQLADSIPQIAWVTGPDGVTLEYLNEQWFDYTGVDPNLGTTVQVNEPIHPDDLPRVLERRGEALRAGEAFVSELRLRAGDGSYRWFLTRSVPVHNGNGTIIKWFGTSTDIDDAKRAETSQRFLAEVSRALASSLDPEETLRRLTHLVVPALADYCFVDLTDADGKLRRVTWAHADLAEQHIFDEHLARYLPPHLHPEHPISRTLETGEAQFVPDVTDSWLERIAFSPHHLQFMRGRKVRSQITVPLRARDRTIGAVTLCFTDTSGRRFTAENFGLARDLAERVGLALDNARLYTETRDAESKVRRLLDAGVVGVIVTNSDRILEANGYFLEMVGYTREELDSGRLHWPEMTPPEYTEQDARGISELEERGVCTPFEKEYIRRDGSHIPVLLGAAALQRDPPLWICFILDLTERKRAEDEWRAFVDATAHDLRNPLTAVLGQTQLLQRRLRRDGGVDPEDAEPRLAAIASSAARASGLIDDLMDTARLQAGQPLELRQTSMDLVSMVLTCAEEAQRIGSSHTVRVAADAAVLGVHADRSRIERVIRNMLDKAIKYSPTGGDILIRNFRDEH
ncbi:MAG: PAS domain S-box protein [Chloroflexi bacterium]|nr:PAS domain S-box protein [Chloroflexota bacterium]